MGFVRLSLAFLAAGLLALAGSARAETFTTAAEVALVEDYDTGAILYEKNADQPTPPASTAKLLTAEIVFRELEGRPTPPGRHLRGVREGLARGRGARARRRHVPRGPQPCESRGPLARTADPVGKRRGDDAGRGHRRHGRSFRRHDEQTRGRTRHGPFAFRQRAGQSGPEPKCDCARHGRARRAYHPRRPGLLSLFRREGVHLEQDPPAQPQSAADHGHRGGRTQGRRRRRWRLRTRGHGGSGRPAPHRRDVRSEVSDRTRRGGPETVRLRLSFVRPAHAVRGRADDRDRVRLWRPDRARSRWSASVRSRYLRPAARSDKLVAKIVYTGPWPRRSRRGRMPGGSRSGETTCW